MRRVGRCTLTVGLTTDSRMTTQITLQRKGALRCNLLPRRNVGDVLLAQKIALESFEDEALQLANPMTYRRHCLTSCGPLLA